MMRLPSSIVAIFLACCVAAQPKTGQMPSSSADFAARCVDSDKYEGRPLVVIDFDSAKSFPEYEELDMDGHFKALGDFQIVRESSQVRLIMPFGRDEEVPILSGGELFGSYRLREVRFAWGKKSNLPSRHVLSGERFPLEMHLIHQKVPLNKYSIRDTHEPMTDLAVIAVLFEESPKSSPSFSNLVNMILSSKNQSEGVQLTLGKLFPQDLDVFFRYEELMMDPSCQAHVSWTVFPTPARLPMKEFRRLQSLYKSSSEEKGTPDKEYTLNLDVRLMSPPREISPQIGLAPPDMHRRPAYGLLPPSQHDSYSEAVDHRGINIYHVFHDGRHLAGSVSGGGDDDAQPDLAQPEAVVIPAQSDQGYPQDLNHESKAQVEQSAKSGQQMLKNGGGGDVKDSSSSVSDYVSTSTSTSAKTSALVSASSTINMHPLLFSVPLFLSFLLCQRS